MIAANVHLVRWGRAPDIDVSNPAEICQISILCAVRFASTV